MFQSDCSISFHKPCLMPFPWVCGTKGRMTGFSFRLLGSLIPSHHCLGGSWFYRPEDSWKGQRAVGRAADRKRKKWTGNRKEEGRRRDWQKERRRTRVKSLMSSAGRCLSVFISRISDSTPAWSERPTREPDQGYVTRGWVVLCQPFTSLLSLFIRLFVH